MGTEQGIVTLSLDSPAQYNGGFDDLRLEVLSDPSKAPKEMTTGQAALFFPDTGWSPYFF